MSHLFVTRRGHVFYNAANGEGGGGQMVWPHIPVFFLTLCPPGSESGPESTVQKIFQCYWFLSLQFAMKSWSQSLPVWFKFVEVSKQAVCQLNNLNKNQRRKSESRKRRDWFVCNRKSILIGGSHARLHRVTSLIEGVSRLGSRRESDGKSAGNWFPFFLSDCSLWTEWKCSMYWDSFCNTWLNPGTCCRNMEMLQKMERLESCPYPYGCTHYILHLLYPDGIFWLVGR